MNYRHTGRLIALSGLAITLLFAAGCLIGGALGRAQMDGAFAIWHSLGQPPAAAMSIEAGDTQTVWVKTADGQGYRADWYSAECTHSPPEAGCWRKASGVAGTAPWQQGEQCATEFPRMPSPPAAMIACASTRELYVPEYYGETSYALLSDGAVWVWAHGASAFGPLDDVLIGRVEGSVAGFLLGLVLVVGLLGWRWFRKRA
jgi:hypothetical protein